MQIQIPGSDRVAVTDGLGQVTVMTGPLQLADWVPPKLTIGSDRDPIDKTVYVKLGGTRRYSPTDMPNLSTVPVETYPVCSWKNITDPVKFNTWASGRKRAITRLHEMDRDPSKGGLTPAQWIEEDSALEDLMMAHPNHDALTLMDIYTGYVSRNKPERSWDLYWRPGKTPGKKTMGFDLEVDRTAFPKGYPAVDKFLEVALYAFRDADVAGWLTEFGWPQDMTADPDGSHIAAWYQDAVEYIREQTIARVAGVFAYDYAKGSTGNYLLTGPALRYWQKIMGAQFI